MKGMVASAGFQGALSVNGRPATSAGKATKTRAHQPAVGILEAANREERSYQEDGLNAIATEGSVNIKVS